MIADVLPHDCGPYCRDDNHAAVVWCTPNDEETAHDILLLYCEHWGVRLVHVEEAHEVPPLPAGTACTSYNIETWERTPSVLGTNARPFLLVWAEAAETRAA